MCAPRISPAPVSSIEPLVLFEDAWLIALAKPAGMPVQADQSGDPDLLSAARRLRPGNRYLELAHRIDRPVSGAVLFAREPSALAALHGLFRDHAVEKRYWAIVEGKTGAGPFELAHAIQHDTRAHRARFMSGGKPNAHMRVSVLAQGDRFALVEAVPQGGLFHQVRSQLAAWGHPIKGDVKYGARRGEADRSIALHALSLRFNHPITGAPLVIEAPRPSSGIWPMLLALQDNMP